MDATPQLLTVATLIKDLQDFSQDAEVAVIMHGIPVTLPIGFITKAQATNEDKALKNYVLFVVSAQDITKALSVAQGQELMEASAHEAANSLLQLN